MATIILSNGETYECKNFGIVENGYLFISVFMSIIEAASVFGVPDNLSRIEYHPSDGDEEGYALREFTILDYIVNEGETARVALRRPINVEAI